MSNLLADIKVTNNQKVGNVGCFQLIRLHTNTHARMHAHNNNYVNVLGQFVEHDGHLQDHDRRLGEVQSKTSFILAILFMK